MFYPHLEHRSGDNVESRHVHRHFRRSRGIRQSDSKSYSESADNIHSGVDVMPNYSELRKSLKHANSQSKIAVLELERKSKGRIKDHGTMENEEIIVEEKRALVHIPSRSIRKKRTSSHIEYSKSSHGVTGTRTEDHLTSENVFLHELEKPLRLRKPSDKSVPLKTQIASSREYATCLDPGMKTMGKHRELNVYSLHQTKVSVKVMAGEQQRVAKGDKSSLVCTWTGGFDCTDCVQKFKQAACIKYKEMQTAMTLCVRPRAVCSTLLVVLAVLLTARGLHCMLTARTAYKTQLYQNAANLFYLKTVKAVGVVRAFCKFVNLVLFTSKKDAYAWLAKVISFMESLL